MLANFFQFKITEIAKRLYGVSDIKVVVSQPSHDGLGDLTTNAAFQLAKRAGKSPTDVVSELITELKKDEAFAHYVCDISERNGHLNWSLNKPAFSDALYQLYHSDDVGQNQVLLGTDISIEFVSANPTGPISIVNGRAGVLGDTLYRIFSKSGAYVNTHYYVNDNPESGQIMALQATFNHYDKLKIGEESKFPENGYKGEFIKKAWEHYDKMKQNCPTTISAFFKYGVGQLSFEQMKDLHELGIGFSIVTRENEITQRLNIQDAFKYSGKNLDDFTYVLDGATWLKTTDFGDDKDRVIIREDGRPTYFHNDIIYHAFKLMNAPVGVRLINIWGADHHGYIARINAVMRMWGKSDVEIILTQMVSLETEEDGKSVSYVGSKREGQYLLLKNDFVDRVGKDAARWYFLNGDPATHVTINVEKAAEQNMSNPVFYIQYAHARFCSILSKSAGLNVSIDNKFINLDLNDSPIAKSLILKLDMYNEVVQKAALNANAQTVKTYLYELAQIMHAFYEKEKLIQKDREHWLAGLYLVQTSTKVLKDGLNLLGISAPEVMRNDN